MPEKAEVPKPLDNEVAMNVVLRHHLDNPSLEFIEGMKRNKQFEAIRAIDERKVKLRERTDLLSLQVQAVTYKKEEKPGLPQDDESCCLNDEEQKAYCDTVDQCVLDKASTPEDQEALRLTMTEVIFKPKVFRVHYEKWKSNWDSSSDLQKKFPNLKDYVLDRAKAFVEARRNEIIGSRLRKFQKDSLPKASSDAQQEDDFKALNRKTLKFIENHQEDLLAYSGLKPGDPKREQLFQKFVLESGLKDAEVTAAHKLFEDIIDDMEVAFTAEKKLEARNSRMIEKAQKALDENKDIDEEDWNKMLDDELKKDPFFKEAMQQQQSAVYQGGSADTLNKGPSLNSAQAVGLEAGGLAMKSYDAATDRYIFSYPNNDFEVTMKIVPKKGSKTLDDAKFIFYDKYKKDQPFSFKKFDLRSGSNQMFLDYLMNDWFRKNETSSEVDMNAALKEPDMASMAENLLQGIGTSLNKVSLTQEPFLTMFKGFFDILKKGEPSENTPYGDLGSVPGRINLMNAALARPDYAHALAMEFQKEGVKSFTLSTLIKYIEKNPEYNLKPLY